MFEKEAEDNKPPYAFCALDTKCELWKDGFQKGAKFGFNKANEWHYVKDELPEKEKYVLIYTDIENLYIARLVKNDYFINRKGGFVQTSAVIAWKEIVLPKEMMHDQD